MILRKKYFKIHDTAIWDHWLWVSNEEQQSKHFFFVIVLVQLNSWWKTIDGLYTIQILMWTPLLCDKVCQWLVAGWWFSPATLVFSTNKTNRHDISDILYKPSIVFHHELSCTKTITKKKCFDCCSSFDTHSQWSQIAVSCILNYFLRRIIPTCAMNGDNFFNYLSA
jgi:hypothetical protein